MIRHYALTCVPATGKVKATKLLDLAKTGLFCGNEVAMMLPGGGQYQAGCLLGHLAFSCSHGLRTYSCLWPDLSDVADALQTLLEQCSLTGPCLDLVLEIVPPGSAAADEVMPLGLDQ